MAREIERRNLAQPVELRAAPEGSDSPGTLFGYAAKFGVYSQDLGGFVEQIDPVAFNKSLADEVRVLCRYNHKDMALLGTTEAGTLTLGVDDVGLFYEDALPNTTQGRDVAVLAERGDLRYSSFAFYCFDDDWFETPQGHLCRTLRSVQLVDVAPVNTPAYLDSTVGLRSLSERIGVAVSELSNMKPEEVRSALSGAPSEAEAPPVVADAPPVTDDVEQRETHSTPISIRRRRAEWDAAA